MHGKIEMFRPAKLYGFIRSDDGAPHVFFHWRSIIEDFLGRRRADVGIPVEYEIDNSEETRAHARARYVRCLWDDEEDIATYREESVVTRWFKKSGSGIARRPDGGTVAVNLADVITDGQETLGVGSHILHRVRPPEMGQRFWTATEIEIFLPQSAADPGGGEVWPPLNTKPIERDVIAFPQPSPLLSERFKNKRLRNIRIRKAS